MANSSSPADPSNCQATQSWERYSYSPLDATGEIRLLRLLPPQEEETRDSSSTEIKCELFKASLSTKPRYSALSYRWGDSFFDCTITIRQNGIKVLPVNRNLFIALKRLRLPTAPRILWIDQLCIDQENVNEKSHQIQQMRQIYEKAQRTIVWLGDHDKYTYILEKMFVQLSASVRSASSPRDIVVFDQTALSSLIDWKKDSDGLSYQRRNALRHFLDLEWFRRAWVYQEVVVAADVQMIWGFLHMSFEFVAGLVFSTYSLVKGEEVGNWGKEIKETNGFGPLRSIWHDRQQFHEGKPLDFLYILWRARKYLEATDQRDLVYSFLGFLHLPKGGEIIPDYTVPLGHADYARAVENTFTIVARRMIKYNNSLDIFQVIVPTTHSSYHLPSWVPNWSERRFESGAPIFTPGMARSFKACRNFEHKWISSGSRSQLYVKGHIISEITSILKHQCGQTYLSSTLTDALKLEELTKQVSDQMKEPSRLLPRMITSIVQKRRYDKLERSVLRTLLADGAFALRQPIEHPLPELLRVYNLSEASIIQSGDKGDYELYYYLRETGNIANGKRVFLTNHLDIGLGYSTIKEGDIVCVLYGSMAPCVLRKASSPTGCYKLIGHCYLDGWMYGENPKNWNWSKEQPQIFGLV
jgi:hypothetical protein